MHDIRLVEDNWESPTLGAWGLGWEIWLNGMEVTQFTYFQQVGGLDCRPVMGEITYGLERLAMYLQGVESIFDLVWTDGPLGRVTYGDVYHQNEVEQSKYNFELADVDELFRQFDAYEANAARCSKRGSRCRPTSRCCKASHTFNLLDARKAISVTERQRYILRVRTLASGVAEAYYASREALGFPMLRATQHGESQRQLRRGPRMSPSATSWSRSAPKNCRRNRCSTLARAFADGVEQGTWPRRRSRTATLESFATPRRLAVRVRRARGEQPDQ